MSLLYLPETVPALASKQIHYREPAIYPKGPLNPGVQNDLGNYTYPAVENKWGSFADFPANNPNPITLTHNPVLSRHTDAVTFNLFDGNDVKQTNRIEWANRFQHNNFLF